MNFSSAVELLEICERENLSIGEVMIRRENQLFPKEDPMKKMERVLDIMEEGAHRSVAQPQKTLGGLIGGEAYRLTEKGTPLLGDLPGTAVRYAMGIMEVNGGMGLIVAAPTAGSSGVVPGVLLSMKEHRGISRETIIQGLFTASAIGYLAMKNATVAGAVAGCQAEIGVAAAMAAAAAVEVSGGTAQQCFHGASIVLMNMLGLVCDPVGGLVEVPCQNRNAAGAVNALAAADLALAGIPQIIDFDTMLQVMYKVGRRLPPELRETALGGVAEACGNCFCTG